MEQENLSRLRKRIDKKFKKTRLKKKKKKKRKRKIA